MNEQKEQELRRQLGALGQQRIADDIDLWPAIRDQIQQSARRRRARQRRLRLGLLSLLGLLILASALLAFSPQARAAVQQYQKFAMILIGAQPVQNLDTQAPPPQNGPTPAATEKRIPLNMSQAEIQSRLPFALPVPGWLPEGLTYQGGSVAEEPSGKACGQAICSTSTPIYDIVLSYGWEDPSEGGLDLQIWSGQPSGGYVFPQSAEQSVQVNGRAATYVLQTWEADPQASQMTPGSLQALSWQDQKGFTYLLTTGSLKLSSPDLIRMAESIKPATGG
jgi:hypothetical protein